MDPTELREYLLSLKGVSEEQPFGPTVVVYKVMGKMFALTTYSPPLTINLKCEPRLALQLREEYAAVKPGYHMNKNHWNTVTVDGSIPRARFQDMVKGSYNRVVEGLPARKRKALSAQDSTTGEKPEDWRLEFLRDISR